MIQKSEQINDLAAALSAFQGDVENADKNKKNDGFRSTYADLAEVLNTIREPLSKHGLALAQFPSYENETGVAHVESILMHKSGQWLSCISSAPVTKRDAQGVGSATTYLRRYGACAITGISQEDDDGNKSTGKTGGTSDRRPAGGDKEKDKGASQPPAAQPPKADPQEALKEAFRNAKETKLNQMLEKGWPKDEAIATINRLVDLLKDGGSKGEALVEAVKAIEVQEAPAK